MQHPHGRNVGRQLILTWSNCSRIQSNRSCYLCNHRLKQNTVKQFLSVETVGRQKSPGSKSADFFMFTRSIFVAQFLSARAAESGWSKNFFLIFFLRQTPRSRMLLVQTKTCQRLRPSNPSPFCKQSPQTITTQFRIHVWNSFLSPAKIERQKSANLRMRTADNNRWSVFGLSRPYKSLQASRWPPTRRFTLSTGPPLCRRRAACTTRFSPRHLHN